MRFFYPVLFFGTFRFTNFKSFLAYILTKK